MELDYIVRRSSKRKKLTITIERDRQVVVHAPVSTSDEKISEILISKKQWIYEKTKHIQKYNELPHPPGKEVVNGESALYLGRQYQIEIVKSEMQEIVFDQRFIIPESLLCNRKKILQDWYITHAEMIMLPKVDAYAKSLGVKHNKTRIVDNRFRWGSCTPQDNINLNWRLIKAPMYVVDYVIVHELAHLIETNHTAPFWNIVRAQSPKMEKAKQWLMDHGQLLEEEI